MTASRNRIGSLLIIGAILFPAGCAKKPVLPVKEEKPPFPEMEWREAFEHLLVRLKKDGLTEAQLKPFNVARLEFVQPAVEKKMLNIVRTPPDIVLTIDENAIKSAKEFLSEHKEAFESVEKGIGVSS